MTTVAILTPTCQHMTYTTGPALPYDGAVAHIDRAGTSINLAAHGNVRHVSTCDTCGARRSQLVNGVHVETGAWGPSRASRERRATQAAQHVESLAHRVPRTVVRRGDVSATLTVDAEGYLRIEYSTPGHWTADDDQRVIAAARADADVARALDAVTEARRVMLEARDAV